MTYIGVYVDDLVITGDDTQGIEETKAGLARKFRISDLKECKWLLGCELQRNFSKRTAVFRQTKFIEDVLHKFQLEDVPTTATPAAVSDKVLKSWVPDIGSKEHKFMTERTKLNGWSRETIYRGIVGSLLWIARCTRPDISFIVSQLSRFMQRPSQHHLSRAIRACGYLAGTKHIGICLGNDSNLTSQQVKRDQVYTYSDASFCDQEDSKSSYGYLLFMNGSPLTWAARTQIDLALSTCEAEYIALSHATSESLYMMTLMEELGYKQDTVPIFVDNLAAKAISEDPKHHSRTRHIRMRYHHTRHEVSTGNVRVEYMKTTELPADLMTKSLTTMQHTKLRQPICGS